jgi:hypothetical protein
MAHPVRAQIFNQTLDETWSKSEIKFQFHGILNNIKDIFLQKHCKSSFTIDSFNDDINKKIRYLPLYTQVTILSLTTHAFKAAISDIPPQQSAADYLAQSVPGYTLVQSITEIASHAKSILSASLAQSVPAAHLAQSVPAAHLAQSVPAAHLAQSVPAAHLAQSVPTIPIAKNTFTPPVAAKPGSKIELLIDKQIQAFNSALEKSWSEAISKQYPELLQQIKELFSTLIQGKELAISRQFYDGVFEKIKFFAHPAYCDVAYAKRTAFEAACAVQDCQFQEKKKDILLDYKYEMISLAKENDKLTKDLIEIFAKELVKAQNSLDLLTRVMNASAKYYMHGVDNENSSQENRGRQIDSHDKTIKKLFSLGAVLERKEDKLLTIQDKETIFKEFAENFIAKAPEEVREDIRARLKNSKHIGGGNSSSQVIMLIEYSLKQAKTAKDIMQVFVVRAADYIENSPEEKYIETRKKTVASAKQVLTALLKPYLN